VSPSRCRPKLPENCTDWQDLQKPISEAIRTLCRADKKLFAMEVNEVTISSQLACYLRHKLEVWDVDAEYNRVLKKGRTKQLIRQHLIDSLSHFSSERSKPGLSSSAFQEYLRKQFTRDDFAEAEAKLRKTVKPGQKPSTEKITKPDIVVHERGCLEVLEHNLVVIELKPSWSKERSLELLDLARLREFVTPKVPGSEMPTYQYGLFLYFTKQACLDRGWLFSNTTANFDPVEFALTSISKPIEATHEPSF
jgi:hypothetical protein